MPFPLDRPLIIFDCETTGSNPYQDRIVSIGFLYCLPDGTENPWHHLVNPGIPIPKEATEGNGADFPGHGITDEMVASEPTFQVLAPHLLKGFRDCCYLGYNLKNFDLPLLQAEFKRAGHAWSYKGARVFDVFRIWQIGQHRTLSDASDFFLGRKHVGAHDALADVRVARDIFLAQLELFHWLPRDPDALHDLQWPAKKNALDAEGKIVWKDGQAIMNFGKKWKGTPLKLMTRRDLDWISDPEKSKGYDFSEELRGICRRAVNGDFPTPPQEKGE